MARVVVETAKASPGGRRQSVPADPMPPPEAAEAWLPDFGSASSAEEEADLSPARASSPVRPDPAEAASAPAADAARDADSDADGDDDGDSEVDDDAQADSEGDDDGHAAAENDGDGAEHWRAAGAWWTSGGSWSGTSGASWSARDARSALRASAWRSRHSTGPSSATSAAISSARPSSDWRMQRPGTGRPGDEPWRWRKGQGGLWYKREVGRGPPEGGHACPQSSSAGRTERNKKRKVKKQQAALKRARAEAADAAAAHEARVRRVRKHLVESLCHEARVAAAEFRHLP